MRVDAYIRVSRVGKREGDNFISPEVQREQIEGWARAHGAQVATVHIDLDESGGKIDRPGFQKMLERVESGQTDGVVVAKLDRFARSLPGALEAIRRIDVAKATFTSVAEGIDPTTPAGKMMHRLMLILAEFELDRITEGWATAQGRAIERGVHFMVPFGYIRPAKGAPLEPDPKTAPLVQEVFRRRAAGASWTELADFLNASGPSPTGQRWTGRTAKHIINNRAYLGEAYHGQFRRAASHPAIVTAAEWNAVQGKPGLRPVQTDALLVGIVRCAGCQYRMKSDRAGRPRVRIYRCRGDHGAGKCPAPASVTAELLEAHVGEAFLARYGSVKVRGGKTTRKIADVERRLAEAEAELDAFAGDLTLRKALGHDRFVAQVQARADAVDEAKEELERVQLEVGTLQLAVAPQTWARLKPAEKRQLIRAGVGAVFLRRTGNAPLSERALILWPEQTPNDLPGPGQVVPFRSFDWRPSRTREATA